MSLIFNLQERHIISADNGDDDDFKAWFFKNRQVPYTAQKMKFSIEVYLIFCAVLIAALSFPNLRTRHVMSRNRINSHRKSVHIKKKKKKNHDTIAPMKSIPWVKFRQMVFL